MKHRFKGLLALVLSLVMVFATATSAWAATATSVTIGGVTLNSTTPYLVNGAAAATGTLGSNGCTAYFDGAGTLTLNGAGTETAPINGISANGDLTIKLIGDNFVSNSAGNGIAVENGTLTIESDNSATDATLSASGTDAGIYAWSGDSKVIINGGTVTATGVDNGISTNSLTISGGNVNVTGTDTSADGIYVGSSVSITNATVKATGGTFGAGIDAHDADDENTTISITDATVEATGGEDGIYAVGSVSISGDNTKVTATGKSTGGIVALGNISISGGTVTATGSSHGIGADNDGGSVSITGGTVEAYATADTDNSIGIFAFSKIEISDATVIVGCENGLYTDGTVSIKNSTVTIETSNTASNPSAISCGTLDMNDGSGVWYQWTNDKNATTMNTTSLAKTDAEKPYLQIALPYAVFFNANGGTGTMDRVTGVSSDYTLPANGFTAPTGKEFKGWATSADGEVISATTYSVAGNTTFYAIWTDATTGGGGYIPVYTDPTPVEAPKTFDSGIALSVAVTILSVTGSAWLAKKKEDE